MDYVAIRRVSPADAVLLLRTRLSGAARTWLETVPAGTSFDETVARFRRRFGASDPCRPELMSEFFERRQGPDESAGRYIEDKARLARRMRINNEAFVLQGIIQGLRADVRRDVMLLQPATLEDLMTAATRSEASARAVAAQDRSDNASILAQIAELRVRMNATQPPSGTQRPPSTGHAVVAPPTLGPYMHPDTRPTAVPAAAGTTLAGPNSATSTTAQQPVTVNLMMTDGANSTRGDHGGRGRGRRWRGAGRGGHHSWNNSTTVGRGGHPGWIDPTNAGHAADPATTAPPTLAAGTSATVDNPAFRCPQCGRIHNDSFCRAAYVLCYKCGAPGHFSRCCPTPVSQPLQQ